MLRLRALFGVFSVLALAHCSHETYAKHANPTCQPPEEVFDELSSALGFSLELTRLSAAEGKRYVELVFEKTGGEPPFDLSKLTGMVLIHAPPLYNAYSGAVDGPDGTICHAAAIPKWLHEAVLTQISKEKA